MMVQVLSCDESAVLCSKAFDKTNTSLQLELPMMLANLAFTTNSLGLLFFCASFTAATAFVLLKLIPICMSVKGSQGTSSHVKYPALQFSQWKTLTYNIQYMLLYKSACHFEEVLAVVYIRGCIHQILLLSFCLVYLNSFIYVVVNFFQ